MNNRSIHHFAGIFFLQVLFLLNSGCKKILEVPQPNNGNSLTSAFRDSVSANGTVRGIYVRMAFNQNFEWGGITANAGKSADELHLAKGADMFELNTLSGMSHTLLDPVRSVWTEAYVTIDQINACIEGISTSAGLSSGQKQALLGECYFDRAFIYFNLVNLYGSATALVLTTNIKANLEAASTSQAAVYQQIIMDLQQAQKLMNASYPTTDRARPNSLAATALLARVYLYVDRFADAVNQSSVVINSGLYSPLPNLETDFLKESKEIIWALAAITSPYPSTADGGNFLPLYSNSAPTYQLTSALLNAFEKGDRRSTVWVGSVATFSGQHYSYPQKYRNNFFDQSGTENYVVLRAAEQYLIRAEANCRMNNTAAAVADLNIVRARAFIDPGTGVVPANAILSTGLSPMACMAAVEHERRIELFAEWGNRWFDLKRWPALTMNGQTRADEVLSLLKTDWQPTSKFYPLSVIELQLDPNLKQNPGY